MKDTSVDLFEHYAEQLTSAGFPYPYASPASGAKKTWLHAFHEFWRNRIYKAVRLPPCLPCRPPYPDVPRVLDAVRRWHLQRDVVARRAAPRELAADALADLVVEREPEHATSLALRAGQVRAQRLLHQPQIDQPAAFGDRHALLDGHRRAEGHAHVPVLGRAALATAARAACRP